MSIYPTSTAAHAAIAGAAVLVLGIALGEPALVAWGGTMVVALAVARVVTILSVMRIRAAGFEMLWTGPVRAERLRRGESLVVHAEVRNRDTLAARFDQLRVVASPALDAWVEPSSGEVPAGGTVRVQVHLRALRVGRHGVHGLALEVRGAPGLFEVPLTFANPYGIEVWPRALARLRSLPHGGRGGAVAAAGRAGRRRGDGADLRELREHQPGDPFRRIAWKASARRGVLVVREFEREERDVVWLLLDASVELWSGGVGQSPLDHAIDMVATLATRHLGNGDRVGLVVLGGRELARVPPEMGREQGSRIAAALIQHTGVLEADRCGWDESDLLLQVAEHLRPLDPRVSHDLQHGQVDRLLQRAGTVRAHAPFTLPAPYGRSARDRRLRRYAACFGLYVPPRLQPDRPRTELAIADGLARLAKLSRLRPSVVHVVAPAPGDEALDQLRAGVRRLRACRATVRWTPPPLGVATPLPGEDDRQGEPSSAPPVGRELEPVEQAVMTRALVAQRRGERALRRLGVKLVRSLRSRTERTLRRSVDGAAGASSPPASSKVPGRPQADGAAGAVG